MTSDLWKVAIDMQGEALAAQRRLQDAGAMLLDPAEAVIEAQAAIHKSAEANRRAWALWAEVWGVE